MNSDIALCMVKSENSVPLYNMLGSTYAPMTPLLAEVFAATIVCAEAYMEQANFWGCDGF